MAFCNNSEALIFKPKTSKRKGGRAIQKRGRATIYGGGSRPPWLLWLNPCTDHDTSSLNHGPQTILLHNTFVVSKITCSETVVAMAMWYKYSITTVAATRYLRASGGKNVE